jgi:metallo-beta-lactamase class B
LIQQEMTPSGRLWEDAMRRISIVMASCLMGACFVGPSAFAQNPEAEAAAAAASAAAAQARANAQTSPNDMLEKICRIGPHSREVEIQKIAPFKVFDNLYHVGPCYVSSWILTTPQGNIMFDTSQEPFVDLIETNMKKEGIDPHSIKYIIINHGHTDHFGGAKRLQELTGARVVATPEDWKMIEATAGKPNNRDNNKPTDVPKRDMEVREGDHLDLGDQHLIIHTAPGHTPGNLFIEGIVLHEGAQTYRGIWGGGGLGAPGLAGAEQGVKNAEKLNAVKGVQVYIMTHAWQDPNGYPGGGIHERAKKLAARKPGDPNPFVDPATWDARAKAQLAAAKRVLAQEQAKAGGAKAN